MKMPLLFVRLFFVLISAIIAVMYTTNVLEGGVTWLNASIGGVSGVCAAGAIILLENRLLKLNLKIFNTLILGTFLGFLMGQGVNLILDNVIQLNVLLVDAEVAALIKTVVYLCTLYIGLILTVSSSEKVYASIPFIRFKAEGQQHKDVIIDASILADSRILDLAGSGLLDHHVILPQFLLKELYLAAESSDEGMRMKAKRSLDIIKKLEELPDLAMRHVDIDFPELKDILSKTLRLARQIDAHILTADPNRVQQASYEGVRFINIHFLSNALKPITNAGEQLLIKIQRYGKEARQGIGYLDDGTMVVVNGGADSLGETIRAQVLSVKHTSSGRMIFCNAADSIHSDEFELPNMPMIDPTPMTSAKNYFAVKN